MYEKDTHHHRGGHHGGRVDLQGGANRHKEVTVMGGRVIDLTGMRFGMLTVIEQAGTEKNSSGANVTLWRCRCDCGNKRVYPGGYLRQNYVTSCGCVKGYKAPSQSRLQRELIIGHSYDIAGRRLKLIEKHPDFARFRTEQGYVECYSYFELTDWKNHPKEAR